MSKFQSGLNTPGLNLRPQDTSSQLVGALNSVFAGTAAAAGAYTRIENAKKAERARITQDHARVAQQVFTESDRKRVAQEQAKSQATVNNVQDAQFGLLMDSRADNPEWLLQQGLAGVDNARTDQEKSAWQSFTLSQNSAVTRQRANQETEDAADEMRTYRRGLKVMGAQAASGLDVPNLVRDPGGALENTVDYFLDSLMGASGDDIDDPKMRAAMADVATDMAVSTFYRDVYPKIEQARQLNQETMGHEMVANVSEGFIDGSVDATTALKNIDGVLTRQFANRTPAELQKMRVGMITDTVSHLGELRDGLPAEMAIEKVEALLGALPRGVMPQDQIDTVRNNFYDKQLPGAAERETARGLAQQEAMIRGQVDKHGNPRSRAATLDLMLTNKDFDLIAEAQIKKLGLDPENIDHAFAIASVRKASDGMAQAAIQARSAAAKTEDSRRKMFEGTMVPGDATGVWKAGAMGTNVSTSETVDAMRSQWSSEGTEGVSFDELGISPGSPVDWTKLYEVGGEKALAMITGAEAAGWNNNPGVDLPQEAVKQVVAMMRDGDTGKRLAAQNFMDQLSPSQSNRMLRKIPRRDRAYARAVIYADDLQIKPEELDLQLQRIDQFTADGDGAKIQKFFDSTNEGDLRELRDATSGALEAITKPLGGFASAQVKMTDDHLSSYYFDRVFETAVAASGSPRPTEDDLEAAAILVYGEFEDNDFHLVTVGGTQRFVQDVYGHTNPEDSPVAVFNAQMNAPMDVGTTDAILQLVGRSWDSETPPPGDTKLFMENIAIELASSSAKNPAAFAANLRHSEIEWLPVSPSSQYWKAYNGPNGGVPMIPWVKVGTDEPMPLLTPADHPVWPFLSSARRTGRTDFREEPPSRQEIERDRRAVAEDEILEDSPGQTYDN